MQNNNFSLILCVDSVSPAALRLTIKTVAQAEAKARVIYESLTHEGGGIWKRPECVLGWRDDL